MEQTIWTGRNVDYVPNGEVISADYVYDLLTEAAAEEVGEAATASGASSTKGGCDDETRRAAVRAV